MRVKKKGRTNVKQWKCTVCGYIHTGENAPEQCPVCGAPKEKFTWITDEKAEKTRSIRFPDSADVLVVGSGAAAFSAAISARSRGASVVMLEKAESIGGTTSRSGGGYWIPDNPYQQESGLTDSREDALRYMARYSYPHLYNAKKPRLGLPEHAFSLLEAYLEKAGEMVAFLARSGALQSTLGRSWTGEASVDYVDHMPENKGIRGRTLFPQTDDGSPGYGAELTRQLSAWAVENSILVYTHTEATRILQDENNRVTGLEVINRGEKHTLRANQAVIFGSGGYSHNPAMMLQFQRGPHTGGCAVPTNTGDFIRMAGGVGAQIGNTAGAFRTQSILKLALDSPGGVSSVFYIPGDSVLEVNKYGRRFVDEKRNYTDRTMAHFFWNAQHAEWSQMLTFLIYDSRTASLWQGSPPYPTAGEKPSYLIEGATWEELQHKLAEELDTLRQHTGGFALAPDFGSNLAQSIQRFNSFAKTGKDLDFGRGESAYDKEWTTFPPTVPNGPWPEAELPNYTMHALAEEGPYYAIILAAGTLDTNGGPVIDSRARVLDWNGEVIPGLYGAGNCVASPTANAYWGAGSTLGPAMTFGYIAGQAQGKNNG